MKILKEFREFAIKGNVIDMAIGIVVGTAFGKIVSSFVSDIIMPPVGVLLGGVDFSNLRIILKKATTTSEAVSINYGVFLNTVLDFLIISFAIFLVINKLNKVKKRKAESSSKEESKPSEEVQLLREIRDSLKK